MPKTDGGFLSALSLSLKRDAPVKLVVRESAAVAVVVRRSGGEEVLLIRRAVRAGDPWSDQVALPGGRVGSTDGSFEDAARRETLEEVGIDLSYPGASVFLGYMDSLKSRTEVTVVPCVFSLAKEATVVLNE